MSLHRSYSVQCICGEYIQHVHNLTCRRNLVVELHTNVASVFFVVFLHNYLKRFREQAYPVQLQYLIFALLQRLQKLPVRTLVAENITLPYTRMWRERENKRNCTLYSTDTVRTGWNSNCKKISYSHTFVPVQRSVSLWSPAFSQTEWT